MNSGTPPQRAPRHLVGGTGPGVGDPDGRLSGRDRSGRGDGGKQSPPGSVVNDVRLRSAGRLGWRDVYVVGRNGARFSLISPALRKEDTDGAGNKQAGPSSGCRFDRRRTNKFDRRHTARLWWPRRALAVSVHDRSDFQGPLHPPRTACAVLRTVRRDGHPGSVPAGRIAASCADHLGQGRERRPPALGGPVSRGRPHGQGPADPASGKPRRGPATYPGQGSCWEGEATARPSD